MKTKVLIIIQFFILSLYSQNWTSLGADITGDSAIHSYPLGGFDVLNESVGKSISLSEDGLTLAVSDPGLDYPKANIGEVKVYQLDCNSGNWVQHGQTLTGQNGGDNFGTDIALSGDGSTLLVGAVGSGPFANYLDSLGVLQPITNAFGYVKLYTFNSVLNQWELQNTINGTTGYEIGFKVAVNYDGNYYAFSVDNSNSGSSNIHGAVTILTPTISSYINGPLDAEQFGASIAFSEDGSVIAIGDPLQDNTNGIDAGRVQLYDFNPIDYAYRPHSDILGESANDLCGISIDISNTGDTIIVGAIGNTGTGFSSVGQARVFAYHPVFGFQQIGNDIDGDNGFDNFGTSVSINGNGQTIVVGADRYDPNFMNDAGQVKVFDFDNASSDWIQRGADLNGESSNDWFGHSTAINEKGNIIACGAPQFDYNGSSFTIGQVKTFVWPVTSWTGTTSMDWHDCNNWSTFTVPDSSYQITIPDVSSSSGNFPITSHNITVSDMTVEHNASLSIGPSAGLIISNNGGISNNGIVNLLADSSGTSWLDDFTNNNASFSGNINVQQYVTTGSGLGQRLFGSPVSGGVIQGLDQTYANHPNGLGQLIPNACSSGQLNTNSPYSNLFEWNENAITNNCAQESWFAINDNNPLENGRGYSGWMQDGNVIQFAGTPNTGIITYGGSLSNSNYGLGDADGWHVFSNPYPSSINVDAIRNAGWESLQTYNAGSGAYSGTYQPILNGQNLSTMQGFVAHQSLNPISVSVSTNVFETTDIPNGTYFTNYTFGSYFDVVNPITINKLGYVDDLGNGIAGTGIKVSIYDINTGNVVPGLQSTIVGSIDPLEGGYRMKSIAPIVLPVGSYVIAAYGDRVFDNPNSSNSPTNIPFSPDVIFWDGYFSAGDMMPTTNWVPNPITDASFAYELVTMVPPPVDVNFDNSMRVQGSTSFKAIEKNLYDMMLDIEINGNGFSDISYLYFNKNATDQFDLNWDCQKRLSDNGQPTLYTETFSERLSLNGKGLKDYGKIIPLGLSPGNNGQFTLSFSGMETFPNSSIVYLEDKQTGIWTDIRTNPNYVFNMNTNDSFDRFNIHFTKPIELIYSSENCEGNNGLIQLNFGEQIINNNILNWQYIISNNQGIIESGTENSLVELTNLTPSTYDIELSINGYSITYQIILEDREQVTSLFEVPAIELFAGYNITFNNLSIGANQFEWQVDNQTISSSNLDYTFDEAGTYEIQLTAENNFCRDIYVDTVTIFDKITGITTNKALQNIPIFCNQQSIIVDLTELKLEETKIIIYDFTGKKIVEKENASKIETINMNSNAKGTYLVKVITKKGNITKKVFLK